MKRLLLLAAIAAALAPATSSRGQLSAEATHRITFDGDLADVNGDLAVEYAGGRGYRSFLRAGRYDEASSALRMGDNSGYLQAFDPAFDFDGSFTVAMWIKPAGPNDDNYYLLDARAWGQTDKPVIIVRRGSGTIVANSGGGYPEYAWSSFPVDEWIHLTFTHDETAETDAFYVNGRALTRVNGEGYQPVSRDPVARMAIGAVPSTGAYRAETTLDELVLFDRGLSAAEAYALYTEGFPEAASYFPLDGTYADTIASAALTPSSNPSPTFGPDRRGHSPGALALNGGSTALTPAPVDYGGSATISMWIYPEHEMANRQDAMLFDARSGNDFRKPYARWHFTNNPYVEFGTGSHIDNYPLRLRVRRWTHLTFVNDLEAEETRLYVNGVEVEATTSGYAPPDQTPTPAIRIGGNFGMWFLGSIDDVAQFGVALEDIEAKWMYGHTPASTPIPDTEPPSTPTDLTVAEITPTQARLAWTPSTDDRGPVRYRLAIREPNTAPFIEFSTVATDTIVEGLNSRTNYEVFVVAVDGAGNDSESAIATFTTAAAPDTQAPATPGALTAADVTPVSFAVDWADATDDVGVAGYEIAYAEATPSREPQWLAVSTRPYLVDGLEAGTPYLVHVRAFDEAGNYSAPATLEVRTDQSSSLGAAAAGIAFGPNPLPRGAQLYVHGVEHVGRLLITDALGRGALTIERVTGPFVHLAGLSPGLYVVTAFAKTGEPIAAGRITVQ